jgi:hypothetical protein
MALNIDSIITSLTIKFLFVPVVWNPWVEKAKEISDFGDDEFPNMVCVESGHVSSPVILLPGTAFEASQILQVSWGGHMDGNNTTMLHASHKKIYCPLNTMRSRNAQ